MVSFRLARTAQAVLHFQKFKLSHFTFILKIKRVHLLLLSSSLYKIQHLNTAGAALNQNRHVKAL